MLAGVRKTNRVQVADGDSRKRYLLPAGVHSNGGSCGPLGKGDDAVHNTEGAAAQREQKHGHPEQPPWNCVRLHHMSEAVDGRVL